MKKPNKDMDMETSNEEQRALKHCHYSHNSM